MQTEKLISFFIPFTSLYCMETPHSIAVLLMINLKFLTCSCALMNSEVNEYISPPPPTTWRHLNLSIWLPTLFFKYSTFTLFCNLPKLVIMITTFIMNDYLVLHRHIGVLITTVSWFSCFATHCFFSQELLLIILFMLGLWVVNFFNPYFSGMS